MANIYLVFVHGWSVTNLSTYGQLPVRLRNDCEKAGIDVDVEEIYLSEYISFHDEVRIGDISKAFHSAVNDKLGGLIHGGGRFICVTHSTGGPVIRDWWETYYRVTGAACPMSHLVMLAPANFGSALAKLGKATIGQLKSWVDGIQPGQGVLDWLELGSSESWDLNQKWIEKAGSPISVNGFYPFVIIGQDIDREFYDHLNAYTGELGSDGVVRSAAANLNAGIVTIQQTSDPAAPTTSYVKGPVTAFRIVAGKSHSGSKMGIMGSVAADGAGDPGGQETVDAIIQCIQVGNDTQYNALCASFAVETDRVQTADKVETIPKGFFVDNRYFIHDKFSMIIFRVRDSEGYPVTDYNLTFTAGPEGDPNHLPEGFFQDRQQNSLHPETVTYFVNYDILCGSAPVMDGATQVRPATTGIDMLGLNIVPNLTDGFVKYAPLTIEASKALYSLVIQPNATVYIDIYLQRLVSRNVFQLVGPVDAVPVNGDFKGTLPGNVFI